jgi:hypothetical protein
MCASRCSSSRGYRGGAEAREKTTAPRLLGGLRTALRAGASAGPENGDPSGSPFWDPRISAVEATAKLKH